MASTWQQRKETWSGQSEDARDPWDVDYSRVIHSASFRRLQGKTQILNLGDSDFYRTRLTHSLEVAQIGGSIVRQLKETNGDARWVNLLPSHSLVQAICLTHDLGHPPFGHGGEVALNYCMRENGGFEANGQTLRILSRLEKFSRGAGSNMTRRALLGIVKYPVSMKRAANPKLVPSLAKNTSVTRILNRNASKPPKCYLASEQDIVDWLLEPLSPKDQCAFGKMSPRDSGKHGKSLHKSLDCSIMDVADDIAYGVHDMEDVIALGLVSEDQFRKYVTEENCSWFLDALKKKYPKESANDVYSSFASKLFSDGGSRKRQIGRLVHHFVTNIGIEEISAFEEPFLRYRAKVVAEAAPLLNALKNFVYKHVIRSDSVQHLEFKGQQMVLSVFEAFATDPKALLPDTTYNIFEKAQDDTRVLCDHLAGMTDSYLLKTYDRLYSPRMGSVFDNL